MIDPKDLRIDNILLAQVSAMGRRPKEPCLVTQITRKGFTVEHGCSGRTAEPVPLTAELLGHAGFEAFEGDGTDRYRRGRMYLEYRFTAGTYKFYWLNQDHTGNTPYTLIKYLHKLQNLYYDLTGEELTFTNYHALG